MWRIALAQGAPRLDLVAFPVASTATKFAAQLASKKMQGLMSDVLAAIEEFQPYRQAVRSQDEVVTLGDLALDTSDADLAVLDRLWNDDKHRATRLVLAHVEVANIRVWGDVQPSDVLIGPIEERSVLARIARSDRDARLEVSLGVVVALNSDGPLGGERADLVLTDLYTLVQARILERGLEVVTYDEQGVSGETIEDRPTRQRLLADIEAGKIKALIAVDWNRLSRDEDIIDGLRIKKACKTTA